MPFNGSGLFNRLFNFQQDRDNNINILADRMDAELDGFATGLSNTIARDGQSTVSANIPFNNRRITGLGNATDPGDALNRATGDARYILDDDDTVKTANIEDDAVTLAKLAADAIDSANHTYNPTASGLTATDVQAAIDENAAAIDENAAAIAALPTDTPIFTKFFESAEQTITSGGALTLSHGLGVEPVLVHAHLVCVTADIGYSPGDKVIVNPALNEFDIGGGQGRGISLILTSSAVSVRYGSDTRVFGLLNKGSGDLGSTENSSWRLVVRAWA